MSKDNTPKGAVEIIVSESGLHVYGTPVTDTLGNKAIVHESSVPEFEGGPLLWLTLQEAGETEGVGVLLDQTQFLELMDRMDSAREVWE